MRIIPKDRLVQVDSSVRQSSMTIRPDMSICQTDLPLDVYQEEFKPYAEEFLQLKDRSERSVFAYLDRYVKPALDYFGGHLKLLAHFYMGGDIVNLVKTYGGTIADSYALAREAMLHPETSVFVESAVHFMAETIALLAHSHQEVWITNPKSGCTMEALAKEDMVSPVCEDLIATYGDDLIAVCYMNTSGRLKAIAGQTGGAVCTSSNASTIMRWAVAQGKKVLFLPDRHLGENSGRQVGISKEDMYIWPAGFEGSQQTVSQLSKEERSRLDRSKLVLWGSFCGVHTVYQPWHVSYFQERGYKVYVHPECSHEVVSASDGSGSTNYLWNQVLQAQPGDKLAIGTEGHFVKNARQIGAERQVDVVNLADIPDPRRPSSGCGCATMSRNDPPHLAGLLDLLRQGKAPDLNRVFPGDVVNEQTGWRERLDPESRKVLVRDARRALEKMIDLTEEHRQKNLG